jgi:hypothetical protein
MEYCLVRPAMKGLLSLVVKVDLVDFLGRQLRPDARIGAGGEVHGGDDPLMLCGIAAVGGQVVAAGDGVAHLFEEPGVGRLVPCQAGDREHQRRPAGQAGGGMGPALGGAGVPGEPGFLRQVNGVLAR